MMRSRKLVLRSAVAALTLSACIANAQTFPAKPVRIVTSPVGGANDTISRIIAQGISEPLGQPVIVEIGRAHV